MKICLLDTAYPDFLRSLPFDPTSSYERELAAVLSNSFGTADFFSRNLRALGHECVDIIANCYPLQQKWMREDHEGWTGDWSSQEGLRDVAMEQIRQFNPDGVFMQDLSFFDSATLAALGSQYLLAGQCSCPMPKSENVSKFALLLTSFPHYVKRLESLGVKSIYLPLAFEPSVLEGPQPGRDIDISFVGGVGRNSHWQYGTDILEAVAAEFKERFHWYGYGLDNLSASSPLRACYRGEAWGRQMYDVYRRSKCVVNRHGEVAEGYANNLRMYEATGCGALLMTERAPNLKDLFPDDTVAPYSDARELCSQIKYWLAHDQARETVAGWGQDHTLANHTYEKRMRVVSDVLQEMLYGSKAAIGTGTTLFRGNGDTPERFFPINTLKDTW